MGSDRSSQQQEQRDQHGLDGNIRAAEMQPERDCQADDPQRAAF